MLVRRVLAPVAAAVASVALAAALPVAPAEAATPLPASIDRLPATTTQLITVEGGYSSTYARLTAWSRTSTGWVVRRQVTARVGWSGLSDMGIGIRRQNDGTTPTGLYKIGYGFGPTSNPGTKMPWVRYGTDDWWALDPRDPKTYNIRQTRRPSTAVWRTSQAERLWSMRSQYRPAFLIRFNMPKAASYVRPDGQRVTSQPADTRLGGAIFLHVNGSSGVTAGCVSVSQVTMDWIARWLDPARDPQIAIGTTALIRSM